MMKLLDFIMVLVAVILIVFFLVVGYSKTVGTIKDVDLEKGTIETK